MTNDEAKALGQRAVACKGWRWMPGILNSDGARIVDAYKACGSWSGVFATRSGGVVVDDFDSTEPDWPDFRDQATMGCLWSLALEIKPPSPDHPFTRCLNDALFVAHHRGPLDAKVAGALVAALEAAR